MSTTIQNARNLGLTWGENPGREAGGTHIEWHAPCGCAFHPNPFPHVHPCSDEHKRPDLNVIEPHGDIDWHEYERRKKALQATNPSPEEYQAGICQIIEDLDSESDSREQKTA